MRCRRGTAKGQVDASYIFLRWMLADLCLVEIRME